MTRFSGKRILITGAAGGIGRACVRRFHVERAVVIASDYDPAVAEALVREYGGGPRLMALGLDVTDAEAADSAMAALAADLGPIDHLINGAGMASIAGSIQMTPDMWRKVHAVNLDGTFYMSKAFATQAMQAGRGGNIVNIASVAGLLAIPDRPAYISSKHAVVGLTREMAMEFGTAGIRVNAIAPGIIRTPMTEAHFQDPERAARIRKAHALGRGGTPEEVAGTIAFLCSDDASFITGSVLTVDGGFSAGKAW